MAVVDGLALPLSVALPQPLGLCNTINLQGSRLDQTTYEARLEFSGTVCLHPFRSLSLKSEIDLLLDRFLPLLIRLTTDGKRAEHISTSVTTARTTRLISTDNQPDAGGVIAATEPRHYDSKFQDLGEIQGRAVRTRSMDSLHNYHQSGYHYHWTPVHAAV